MSNLQLVQVHHRSVHLFTRGLDRLKKIVLRIGGGPWGGPLRSKGGGPPKTHQWLSFIAKNEQIFDLSSNAFSS